MSAPIVVASGFVPNSPTGVYTFAGSRPNARGCVTFLSLVNTGAATEVNFRIAPAGATITDDDWCVIPKDTILDAVGGDDPWGVYCKDDYNAPSHVLMEGDRVVLDCADADRVAYRLVVQELGQ